MNKIIARAQREPVLVITLVATFLSLLVSFGVPLTDVQSGSIVAVIVALSAFTARKKVKPAKSP